MFLRLLLLLFLCLLAQGAGGRDFYKILGLRRDADDASIKKAYRKLAKQWHPDKVKDDDKTKANQKFADISAAYEVLSDPDKRRMFDQVGEEGIKQRESGGGGGGPGAGFPQGGFPGGGGGFHHQGGSPFGGGGGGGGGGGFQDPFNLFQNMFQGGGGGGFPGGGPRRGGGGGGGGGGGRSGPPPVLYSAKATPDVQRLTRATFNSVASRQARGATPVLLHLYDPAAPAAQALAPALQRLAAALRGAAVIASVNCASERGVCASAGLATGQDTALRLLYAGGGSESLQCEPLARSLGAGRPPLKALAPVWEAISRHTPSRVGTLPASRAALDKLARRCADSGGSGRSAVAGCVVLFSASARVSPVYAALSSTPAFDPVQAGGGAAFVFAQAEVATAGGEGAGAGAGSSVDKASASAAAAVDLGIKEVPALLLLRGSSLEEWRLGGQLQGEELRQAGRTGYVLAPKAALESTTAMRAWLGAQSKALKG